MARTVHVVPHTHWDREWYRSAETFRMQLTDLLDELLPTLAADPAYAHFMLDGQMAVVDDYLAARPDAEPRLRRLASTGRLTMGPWYILMDEFLVSGETMVRNLQLGLDRAAAFGGAMEVGYLPDMFGHVAQMPQLLRQFGFDRAVVWRGVPAEIDRAAFRWEAPDGSSVRATYLASGYSNGAMLPTDAKDLVAMIEGWCAEQGARAGEPVLWMNGTDHLLPQAHLGRVVAEANELQDRIHIEVTSLRHHLDAAEAADAAGPPLPVWRGELRSGARSNLLMGVTSNRVDVRMAEARTTTLLERVAEPLAALYLPTDRWPSRFLADAWLHVIRNSAHDSICACSVDEVGRAVIHRYDQSADIARGVIDRALAAIAVAAGGRAPIVVNPTARARTGLVEVRLPGDADIDGTQVVSRGPSLRTLTVTTRAEVETLVHAALGAMGRLAGAGVEEGADGTLVVRLAMAGAPDTDGLVDTGQALADLRSAVQAGPPSGTARVDVLGPPRQRALVRATVDGYGWARWSPAPLDVAPVRVEGDAAVLDNGLVRVEVDRATGTWAVDGLAGFGRLVDGGDAGDTYNWCPPAHDVIVDQPDSVTMEAVEHGPLRARLAVTTTYHWPAAVVDGRREGDERIDVRTILELRAGDDVVRVTHRFDNRCDDHRLRVWFPLLSPARASLADTAYGSVERGLEAEGGPNELGLPTFPSRRFVVAGGLTLVHDGLPEYELVDISDAGDGDGGPAAHQLALTLIRATGVISQGPMATRPVPAGPQIAAGDAQVRGAHELAYALHTGGRDPWIVADEVLVPLLAARARPGAVGLAGLGVIAPPVRPGVVEAAADRGSALEIDGAEVAAVLRTEGRLTIRVCNPRPEPTTVALPGRSGWLVDLRGRAIEPFEDSFDLRPHGIATAVLDHG